MFDLTGRKDSGDPVNRAESTLPVYDDLAESDVCILRALYFAAGPTAAFWLSLILGIKLLLR